MIKAVFFDFYGTLVDYDPPREQLLVSVCRELGIEVAAEALRRAIPAADQFFYRESARLPLSKRSPVEKMDLYAEYQKMMLEGAGIQIAKEKALQVLGKLAALVRQSGAKLVLFPDVEPCLAELKSRGLTLGVVTNVDRDISETYSELGLLSYLDFVISSLEMGVEKPDPAIFFIALERAGAEASEAIHVGDQYYTDVVGAKGAGIKPLLLDRDGSYPHFTDCVRIASLGEVVEWL